MSALPVVSRLAGGRVLAAFAARRSTRWRSAHLVATIVVMLAASGLAQAQTKTGTTLGAFLLIEPSARVTALGNAGVALDPGLEGAYYNPAAAGRLEHPEFTFSHVEWFADIRFDHVGAAIPLGSAGVGFLTVASLNSGEIDVRTVSQPLGTGERFTVSDLAIGLGYGLAITDRFAAGIQVKYIQETIWHTSAGTVTFDVGSVYRVRPDGLTIGSSLSNFGTGARYSGRDLRITYDDDPTRSGDNGTLPGERFVQDYPVPVLFRVGVAYPWRVGPEWSGWTVAEAIHPNDNSESMSAGGEVTYRNLVSLRAGYHNLFKKDSEEGLAFGTGLRGRVQSFAYHVDYAWADQGRLGSVHRFALSLTY